MKRLFVTLLFILSCCFTLTYASATSSDGPNIVLSDTGIFVPVDIIKQLQRDFPDAHTIRITGWHTYSTPPQVDIVTRASYPQGHWVYDSYTKNTAQSNATLKDLHIITCATGVQKTLSAAFSQTYSSEVTLSASFQDSGYPVLGSASLGIERSVSVQISQTSIYSGPPAELTDVNSREYRVRWYGNIGGWSGVIRHTVMGLTENVYGSWVEYVGAAEYYIDRYVNPTQ